eukprot:2230533-Alexandrium_andersonii.AAC.1
MNRRAMSPVLSLRPWRRSNKTLELPSGAIRLIGPGASGTELSRRRGRARSLKVRRIHRLTWGAERP